MPSDIWLVDDARAFGKCSAAVRWKFVLLTSFLWITAASVAAHAEGQGPSREFSSHTIVRPRVYHARTKRAITDTRENDLRHADVLTVGFEVDGVQRLLDLRLNTDLIPVGYKQRHQHQGGYKTETPETVELCHYQGSVRGIPDSWVAVSTCRGLKGVVFDGQELHHIHPERESLDSVHYVYKQSDLITNNTCGYEGTPQEVIGHTHEPRAHRTSRYKRAADTVIRGPYNANRQSRYVELVLVIDKKEYKALGETLDRVHHHCKDIANILNALYTPLNIFVALVGVEVWTDTDEIILSSKADVTLSNFLNYRRAKLVEKIPNDNAQLLTRVHFEDGVVGKALKGPICTYEYSGGVNMDHSNVIGLVVATMAHEMGHNFGMEHDSADCSCPEERCIMAPSSGSTAPVHWSSCSLEYLARAFEHGMDYCLRNKPQKLFDSPICGNGLVEPGEQCDCGLKDNCDNPCCNATTCMLHTNASCATGECCDLKTCRPKNAGTECRSAEHECDLPEFCTGQSEYCPGDVFKIDGESCNMGKAFCYQGTCRTHNDQCKLLWGPTASSSDHQCYNMNNKGTKQGNCGYNRVDETYVKCLDEDIFCGMLHCKHLNERLEFGMESVAILSHSFINNGGKIIACRSAMVDLGLNQVDPGLAPDGAKCAPGKMCVNQQCMPIAELRKSVSGGNSCPNDCGGNGVCNSLGHCHCNRGFRPPDCVQPGFGGSDDSGPAEDPNASNDFVTALYIIFFGVIPMMALISLGVWYTKNNPSRHWKKEALSTYVSSLDCFKTKRRPATARTFGPSPVVPSRPRRIGNSKKFFERVMIVFAPRRVSSRDTGKVFTINDGLPSKEKLQITKTDLVSTTNPDAINCSSNIEYRKSMLLANSTRIEFSKANDAQPTVNSANIEIVNKRNSPIKLELGNKISEHIRNFQKPTKNFQGLKLKTELQFEHLNESPCSTSGITPNRTPENATIAEAARSVAANSQAPAPFYNKKPPPPPAPAQNLKPKF